MTDLVKQDLENLVLSHLGDGSEIVDSVLFLRERQKQEQHALLEDILRRLSGFEFVVITPTDIHGFELTSEGEEYCKSGSPESRVFNAIQAGPQGSLLRDVEASLPDIFKIGSGAAHKNKWITSTTDDQKRKWLVRLEEKVSDKTQEGLLEVQQGNHAKLGEEYCNDLRKRKLIKATSTKTYRVVKGVKFQRQRTQLETDLTDEMLAKGTWQTAEFKEYNWKAKGADADHGALHPLMKVRSEFRHILLEMGFEEMPTNNFVESSFWNFDALFQPQQHPARDSHDTFFLQEPTNCNRIPDAEYLARVRAMHETGGYESIGYRYS